MILEIEQRSSDRNLQWLSVNSISDANHDIQNLWESTYEARTQSFAENKKQKKEEYYLSFQCLKCPNGIFLVSGIFLLIGISFFIA